MTEEITEQEAVRPTPERIAKGGVIVPKTDRTHQAARPARVETQTMLDRYRKRKTMDEALIDACERWAAIAHMTGRFPALSSNLQPRVCGAVSWLQDSQVAAGIQRDQAVRHLADWNTLHPLVMDHVCVEDGSAEGWAKRMGLKPWQGIEVLRVAAERTARYFGIIK